MSIFRYVKRFDGLPEANRQVQAARDEGKRKKHGSYNKYDNTERAAIGKYACQYGPAAVARYFSRKLGKYVSENTVKSIKKAYIYINYGRIEKAPT